MSSKKIYFVLTYTGTVLAKIIKYYTKAEYSHVSISLDENLKEMYSFGRLNPYNPFIGGFVQEGIHIGTFKRFHKTTAAMYSIDVTEEQYEKVKNKILEMYHQKQIYKFNIIGLFASGFNIKFRKKNSFYCAEFIKHVLDEAKIELNLPEITKPNDFKNLKDLHLIYRGILRNYSV